MGLSLRRGYKLIYFILFSPVYLAFLTLHWSRFILELLIYYLEDIFKVEVFFINESRLQ